ncbi:MAG: AMP-binding protein [Treponema sp.]|nr:AMP-binding protein [Treponema sp.]
MIKLDEKTLINLCLESSEKYKNRIVFSMLCDGQVCRQITYNQMVINARQIGFLLKQLGVERGGKVMLLSDNCPEWPLAYFGIAFAGAVSVPLLTGFSGEQIQNIAAHAGVRAVCLSRPMMEKFEGRTDNFNSSQTPFIFIDSISGGEVTVSLGGEEKRMRFSLPEKEDSVPELKQDDLATIIYTSGTQGNSKGVMLSGKNIISSALSSVAFIKILPRDRLLSVLPLAHSYECCLGFLAPVINGACITFLDKPPSPSVLLPALKIVRPTVMTSVPLLIEKIYRNSIAPKLRDNKLYKFLLTRPLAIKAAGLKLVSALGGRIRFFGIGGAPLSAEVEKFLHRAGFPYAVGYGLTEAAPLVAGNKPNSFRLNSGSIPARGVKFRVSGCAANGSIHASGVHAGGEGEIEVKGPNVMLGYYKDKDRTSETITRDGWLRTGDLGKLDKKGRLHIRGRLKTLILSPSGENIYPEEIEGLLGTSQLIEDALVYSGEKGELVALVRLSEAAKAAAGAIEHALEELRQWANKKLAVFSRLSRIEIRYEPFEKTPTMKIKRYLYV